MKTQRLSVVTAPTIAELLEDEIYFRYFSALPKLPDNIRHGSPWRIVAKGEKHDGSERWGIKDVAVYREARDWVLGRVDHGEWHDMRIISRRKFFLPPYDFTWNQSRYRWCGRCRTPTIFRPMLWHPALKGSAVITADDSVRCIMCGVREVMVGNQKPRVRPKKEQK
jgi:hypothetical protein